MSSENTSMSAPVHAVVHTPGPWHVFPRGESGMLHVGPARHSVAYVIRVDDERANARLIAAAPDLKEALMKFVAWHDADHESMKGSEVQEMYDQVVDAAKSALSKVM